MTPRCLLTAGSKLKAELVAFDSFGVKGMCTCIRTPELTIVIDPGVSAQTDNFPLPATRCAELQAEYEQQLRACCAGAGVIVISHYHLDHFLDRRDPEIYGDKIILLKSPDDLPAKQQATARRFLQTIEGLPRETVIADGRRFRFGKTEIGFSPPVWHGTPETEPGRVIMTEVSRGRHRLLITSDVAGPVDDETTELIAGLKPDILILDGYPTQLHASPATSLPFLTSLVNVIYLLLQPALQVMVLDHHPARDYRYRALLQPLYQIAQHLKKRFGTAAELAGTRSAALTALENYGTTRWQHWQPLTVEELGTLLESALARGRLRQNWLQHRLAFTTGTVLERLQTLAGLNH